MSDKQRKPPPERRGHGPEELLNPEEFWADPPGTGDTAECPVEVLVTEAHSVDVENLDLGNETALVTSPPSATASPPPSSPERSRERPPSATASRPPRQSESKPPRVSSVPGKSHPPSQPPRRTETQDKRLLYSACAIAALVAVVLAVWLISQGARRGPATRPTPALGEKQPSVQTPIDDKKQPVDQAGQQTVKPGDQSAAAGTLAGSVAIISDPPGAVVFYNDARQGATPTTIPQIPVGTTVSLRIEADGFRPWVASFVLDAKDRNREIHAGLIEDKDCLAGSGWVYVASDPTGASVELDGKRLAGKTPIVIDKVCAGQEHLVRVQAAGRKTWWKKFEVTPKQVMNLNATLER